MDFDSKQATVLYEGIYGNLVVPLRQYMEMRAALSGCVLKTMHANVGVTFKSV